MYAIPKLKTYKLKIGPDGTSANMFLSLCLKNLKQVLENFWTAFSNKT